MLVWLPPAVGLFDPHAVFQVDAFIGRSSFSPPLPITHYPASPLKGKADGFALTACCSMLLLFNAAVQCSLLPFSTARTPQFADCSLVALPGILLLLLLLLLPLPCCCCDSTRLCQVGQRAPPESTACPALAPFLALNPKKLNEPDLVSKPQLNLPSVIPASPQSALHSHSPRAAPQPYSSSPRPPPPCELPPRCSPSLPLRSSGVAWAQCCRGVVAERA